MVVDHVLQEPDIDRIHRRWRLVVALQCPDRRPGEHPDDHGDCDADDDTLEHLVRGLVGQRLVVAVVDGRLGVETGTMRACAESTEVGRRGLSQPVVYARRRDSSTSLLLSLAAATATLAVSAPVLAHIDPDPSEAQAGSTLSVAFTIEHGCDGSPTVQLDMRLPDGVTDAEPEPFEGFEGSIDGDVISYVGGPLADDQEATFAMHDDVAADA